MSRYRFTHQKKGGFIFVTTLLKNNAVIKSSSETIGRGLRGVVLNPDNRLGQFAIVKSFGWKTKWMCPDFVLALGD